MSCESIVVAQECTKRNIIFLAYSPLGGSRIAKKLHEFAVFQRVAEARSVSVHQVALAWVRALGETVIPIPAARTVAHAVDSARAADLVLTEEERFLLYPSRGGT